MGRREHDWLRRPSEDDLVLWSEVMRGVRPLPGRALPALAPVAVAETTPEPDSKAKTKPARRRIAAQPPKPERNAPSLTERGLTGLDGRRAERLRKGEIEIEARLDLHGLTQESAHRALDAFLSASVAAGRRCVLVITGKGTARPEDAAEGGRFVLSERTGILRAMLPHWIEQSAHRGKVVALQPAHRKHGGEGAFYLYLRRAR